MRMFLVFLLLFVLLYLISSKKESFTQDYYPHLYNSNVIPCKK
jgi:hypothetical protein